MATASSKSMTAASTDPTAGGTQKQTLVEFAGPTTHPAITQIVCEVTGDQVRLCGQVPTFYLKQLAQETASHVEGIRCVFNNVEVCANRSSWR
ncbi:BON domain-containing protein [Aeoliella mucimassa]|uniref:BON domain protein n=1 Tax=Aeoliella mucimassa TaxID=2527972 RepID=A0A518AK63_9BACT|nr:BON domain-containing protein [Aeoliella mucimassa]QDU55122.1 BON domain protein [Aeoliella mucimassa]